MTMDESKVRNHKIWERFKNDKIKGTKDQIQKDRLLKHRPNST